MKKAIITAALSLWALGGVPAADAWGLVASYPVPVPNPRGYRVSGLFSGYIVNAGTIPYVYYFHVATGSIFSSFPAPGGRGAWGIGGLYEESYISNNRTSWIYKVTTTGSVVSSFICPIPGPADIDISWKTRCLEIAIPARNVIAAVDPTTGSLISTFSGPGSRPTACCGYSTTLVADAATHTIYENGIPVITGIARPVGADENFTIDTRRVPEGDFFPEMDYWLYVVDDATDRIFWYAAKELGVVPASLGRVKALFE